MGSVIFVRYFNKNNGTKNEIPFVGRHQPLANSDDDVSLEDKRY